MESSGAAKTDHFPTTCPEVGCGCTAFTDDPTGGPYKRTAARKFTCGRVVSAGTTLWSGYGAERDHFRNAQAQVTVLLAHVDRLQHGMQDAASEIAGDEPEVANELRSLAAIEPRLPMLGNPKPVKATS